VVQFPIRTSRKLNVPPVPSSASQYVVPAVTAVLAIGTSFQAPAVGEGSFPELSNVPGRPPASEYRPTKIVEAAFRASM
jgi:hypothetical protein